MRSGGSAEMAAGDGPAGPISSSKEGRWGLPAWLESAPKIPLLIIAIVVLAAVVGPVFVDTQKAFDVRLDARFVPPWETLSNPLGTDASGRDVLARLVLGARVSVSLGVVAIVLGGLWGTALGLLAGYFGGWTDSFLMRSVDVFLPFPTIVLALFVAVIFGPSYSVLLGVIAFVLWARFARLVRGDAVALRQLPYVEASIALGARPHRIMASHMLPNLLSTVVVMATLQVGWVILIESSLSFLGAGVPPPQPTWGGMVAEGKTHLQRAWWLSTFPGLIIMLTVLSMNVLGDWLRDRLDPQMELGV